MKIIDSLISRIEDSINVYNGLEGYMEDILNDGKHYAKMLVMVSEEEQEVIFACRHEIFSAPRSFSLDDYLVSDLRLPADAAYFFEKCPRMIFWGHHGYQISVPGSKIDYSLDESLPHPYGLLRFCRVNLPDACYFALRTKNTGKDWDIVFLREMSSELEEANQCPSTYSSFTEWLTAMVETTGWMPLIQNLTEHWLINVYRKLPQDEVAAKFGDVRALLPQAAFPVWTSP